MKICWTFEKEEYSMGKVRECNCGCGNYVISKWGSTFIKGHQNKFRKGTSTKLKGKTYIEIYGSEEKAREMRLKNSRGHKKK